MAKMRAGITRRLRLYDCRHAFVTNLLEGGADIKAVSEMAGHKKAEITRRIYQHVSDRMKVAAIDTLISFKVLGNTDNIGNTEKKANSKKKIVKLNG